MTKLIRSHSTNPYYNLAIEEWAVRNLDTTNCDYLFLYCNSDCVVVGRNQNLFQEVNLSYCRENKIKICRRVSGGGTVFHDLQNLNWSFISKFETEKVNHYAQFSAPILSVLKKMGINAHLNGRNAIMSNHFKLSGQAQFTNRKNILSHGTLLFDSDIEKLNLSTLIENKKVKSKSSPSVRSNVKTIKELSKQDIEDIESIKNQIINTVCGNQPTFFDIEAESIQEKIKTIQSNYQSTKWLYERASKCIIEEIYNGQKLVFQIEKAKIVALRNEADQEIKQHPILGKNYQDLSL